MAESEEQLKSLLMRVKDDKHYETKEQTCLNLVLTLHTY